FGTGEFEVQKCDESHKHHRAADFWRRSWVFSQLRPGEHGQIQGGRLSIDCAIFERRLGSAKADYIRAHWSEVARTIGARKCESTGRKSNAQSDQPRFARRRT